jgi:hypothetical protein
MRPTIIIWTIAILFFIIMRKVCSLPVVIDKDSNYNTPNRPYVAGAP